MVHAQPIDALITSTTPPERIVLLGKGKSLDRYADQPKRIDWPHMGINETVETMPCDYFIYLDEVMRQVDPGPEAIVLRPSNWIGAHGGRGYYFDKKQLRKKGYETRTSAACAVLLCHLWGVSSMTLVGFDGFDSGRSNYAACLHRNLAPGGTKNLPAVNRSLGRILEQTRMPVTWWHRNHTVTDGH